MEYTEKQLVSVAQRENNNKRGYLVVNPMQGKHVPAIPTKSLELFKALAKKVSYPNEKILIVGFAETATAIGSALAIELNCDYMQTTREPIDGVDYLYFTESHSHATEQKLVKTDLDKIMPNIDRIIFAEDEVTTGNTILKIVNLIKKTYKKLVKFSVASILNGMDEEALQRYENAEIKTHYLVKTDHSKFEEIAHSYVADGKVEASPELFDVKHTEHIVNGFVDARRYIAANEYDIACKKISEFCVGLNLKGKVLVLGTEEFMYPAMYVAKILSEDGTEVYNHATTRSPIAVSQNKAYPLHSRQLLPSVYDSERVTYIYELQKYDHVLIVTDAPKSETIGMNALLCALANNGNDSIHIVRWQK